MSYRGDRSTYTPWSMRPEPEKTNRGEQAKELVHKWMREVDKFFVSTDDEHYKHQCEDMLHDLQHRLVRCVEFGEEEQLNQYQRSRARD